MEVRGQRIKVGGVDGDGTVVDLVGERYGVAAAFEPDGGQVDRHVAAFADDFAVLLVVAGVAAGFAGVQADAVRAAVLEDDDEPHLGAVGRRVCEAMQMPVLHLGEGDGGHAVHKRVFLRFGDDRLFVQFVGSPCEQRCQRDGGRHAPRAGGHGSTAEGDACANPRLVQRRDCGVSRQAASVRRGAQADDD